MTTRELAILGVGLVLGALGASTLGRVTASAKARGGQSSAGVPANDDTSPQVVASGPRTASPAALLDQLRELERRRVDLDRRRSELERREAELARGKADVERRLREAQPAPATSATATPARSRFDLTQKDWAELAKTASVRFCLPNGADWRRQPQEVEQLGLTPADAEALDEAYARSRRRLWEALAPLCPELSDAGPPENAMSLVRCAQSVATAAQRGGEEAFSDARREVAEIRAGLRPMPATGSSPSPIVRLLLAVTGETDALVQDLSTPYGPDEARRIVYRDHGCAWSGGFGQ